jgi:hypothetical protein
VASIIQLCGATAIVVGALLFSIPFGLIVAGIFAVAFGISLERD